MHEYHYASKAWNPSLSVFQEMTHFSNTVTEEQETKENNANDVQHANDVFCKSIPAGLQNFQIQVSAEIQPVLFVKSDGHRAMLALWILPSYW